MLCTTSNIILFTWCLRLIFVYLEKKTSINFVKPVIIAIQFGNIIQCFSRQLPYFNVSTFKFCATLRPLTYKSISDAGVICFYVFLFQWPAGIIAHRQILKILIGGHLIQPTRRTKRHKTLRLFLSFVVTTRVSARRDSDEIAPHIAAIHAQIQLMRTSQRRLRFSHAELYAIAN